MQTGYNICSFVLLFFISMLVLTGCMGGAGSLIAPPPLSSQQRAAMQTKELQGDYRTAFAATISVLQDEGWQIDVVDRESGIIQASSLKRQDVIGPAEDWLAEQDKQYRDKLIKKAKDSSSGLPEWTRWEQLTAHIEPWGKTTVRQRISITRFGSLPPNTFSQSDKKGRDKILTASGKEQSIIVENPATYQYLFQQIQRSIFIREGLSGH
jgi:hypothetical protein